MVDAALVHRQAGVAGLREGPPGVLDRGLQGQGHDAGAGSHHLAHHRVAEGHYVADEFAILGFEDALGLAFLEQGGDGLLGGILLGAFALLGPPALDDPGQGRHQGFQQRLEGRVEGEEPLQPEGGIPGGEQGGRRQIQGPEAHQHQGSQGPGAAGKRLAEGPEKGEEEQQQELDPEFQPHPLAAGALQEGGQPRIPDGALFQQPPPLQGGHGVEGAEEGHQGEAVGQHKPGRQEEPEGGDATAGVVHGGIPSYLDSRLPRVSPGQDQGGGLRPGLGREGFADARPSRGSTPPDPDRGHPAWGAGPCGPGPR